MSNDAKPEGAPAAEVPAEADKKEAAPAAKTMPVITGEIRIVADEKGTIGVSYPQNKIVAYGLLEAAKEIIAAQSAKAAAQEPRIKIAGADALKHLDRKPS